MIASLRRHWRDYRDNTGWHHIWMANGPLWWLCPACREAPRDGFRRARRWPWSSA